MFQNFSFAVFTLAISIVSQASQPHPSGCSFTAHVVYKGTDAEQPAMVNAILTQEFDLGGRQGWGIPTEQSSENGNLVFTGFSSFHRDSSDKFAIRVVEESNSFTVTARILTEDGSVLVHGIGSASITDDSSVASEVVEFSLVNPQLIPYKDTTEFNRHYLELEDFPVGIWFVDTVDVLCY